MLHYLFQTKSLGSEFLTTDNRILKVESFGRLNKNAGPDFNGTIVKLDDLIWAGPIEFHLRSSDWLKHGHQNDEAYNNVIAHFVFEYDEEIRSGGYLLPTVELKSLIDVQSLEEVGRIMNSKSFVPCANQIKLLEKDLVISQIEQAGLERLNERMGLFNLRNENAQKELDLRLAYCFGGTVNNHSMRRLLELAYHFREDGDLEEKLLTVAGFNESGTEPPLSPMKAQEWKFSKMRPPSFPPNRIKQLARYLQNPITVDMIRARLDLNQLLSFLPFGEVFQNNLIINGIAPFAYAMGMFDSDSELKEYSIKLLRSMQAEKNRIVSNWISHGVQPQNALQTQRLIQLKKKMCDQKKCLQCIVGKSLIYGT